MRIFQASIVLCAVIISSVQVRAEWGTIQGDAGHSGYVPITVFTTSPQLLWSTPGMLVQSSLAVGGGNVFFVTHVQGTGWADKLIALDEKTGTVVWNMSPAPRTGDPAYAGGVVYLQTVDNSSLVRGWNSQTQSLVFSATYSNQFTTYRAPVISNGSLFAGGGYYGGVYSYNTATSAVNWANTTGSYASYGGWTPAIDANYVYALGAGGSDLMIYNRTTGTLLSETGPSADAGSGTPLLTGNGGLFYVENGKGHYLDVSNPYSPQVVWSMSGLDAGNSPAYANGKLYISTNLGSSSPTLYALDAATGQEEWSLANTRGLQNAIVTDNVLFAMQGSNTVAIDLVTHQTLWSVPQVGLLAVSDNELFIASDGYVTAYSIATPEPSTLLLLAMGAVGLVCRDRRTQWKSETQRYQGA